MSRSAAEPLSASVLAFMSFKSLHRDLMHTALHEDAAAVAVTHAALWFSLKQMGEMQTVYHDRLQMSPRGQCTLLWKWFGQ